MWAQVPQISLGTQSLQPDGTTSIPVRISSSGNPPAAIQFDVTYDNTMASLAATAGSSATSASKTLYTASLQPNATRMILADMNQNNIGDGTLVNLVVTPAQTGGAGPYAITLSNPVAATANGGNLAISGPGNPGGGPPPFGIANAASQLTGAVAPGEIVSLYIAGLVPSTAAASDLSVTFNGASPPQSAFLYRDPNQINLVTPFGLAGQLSAQVALHYQGMTVAQGTAPVAATATGVFSADASGQGQAVLVNQDGSLNSAANPAPRGSFVTLFATGAGVMTNPSLTDGQVVPLTPTPTSQPAGQVGVQACGADIGYTANPKPGVPYIAYEGPVPGEIPGVLQVNFVVPNCQNTGAVPLSLFVGGVRSQPGLTFAVQ